MTTNPITPERAIVSVRPGVISETLLKARTDNAAFMADQKQWMQKDFGLLEVLVGGGFERAIREFGPEVGEAVRTGLVFGTAIIRAAIEEGVHTVQGCHENLDSWGALRAGVRYTRTDPPDPQELDKIFGEVIADEFRQIKHEDTRMSASFLIGVSLSPQPPRP